jgi:rubrerythrin
MYSVLEILDLALQVEENGEAFYRDAVKRTEKADLRSLLEWLAEEEAKHRDWFAERKEAARARGDDSVVDEAGSNILRDILGNQTFSLQEAELSSLGETEDLLEIAREFEKDTVLFFEIIRSLVDDRETLEALGKIIEEENSHIQRLQEYGKGEGDGAGKDSGRQKDPSKDGPREPDSH